MGAEKEWREELDKVKSEIKTIRENEIRHINGKISSLENTVSSSIKRVLPFMAALFVVTLLGLFAIFYGFTYDVWSAIWGGFGTVVIILASIMVTGRRH